MIFDQPNGTLINGLAFGASTWSEPNNDAVVQDGFMVSANNTYPAVQHLDSSGNPSPLKVFGGTFVCTSNIADRSGTLIADKGNGATGLQDMIHYNFGPTGWEATIRVGNAPPPWTVLATGKHNLSAGAEYRVEMVIDAPNNTVTFNNPDGSSTPATHPAISSMAPTWARYQIFTGIPGTTYLKWGSAWMEPQRNAAIVAQGLGAPMQDVTALKSSTQSLAVQKTIRNTGLLNLATFTTSGAQSTNLLRVVVTGTVGSLTVPGVYTVQKAYWVTIKSDGSKNILDTVSTPEVFGTQASAGALDLVPTWNLYAPTGQPGVLTIGFSGVPTGNAYSYFDNLRMNVHVQVFGDPGGIPASL
jgi:hypothetical protein